MKKLEVKNTIPNTKEILKANLIIEKARQEIKDFIVYEIVQIYNKLGYSISDFSKEEVTLTKKDFSEHTTINKIKLPLDEEVYVELDNVVGEICWRDLGTDELVTIANVLQRTYNNLIK